MPPSHGNSQASLRIATPQHRRCSLMIEQLIDSHRAGQAASSSATQTRQVADFTQLAQGYQVAAANG